MALTLQTLLIFGFVFDPSSDPKSCMGSGYLVAFESEKKIGYKDLEGEVILSPRWTYATDFNNCGYAYADGFYIGPDGQAIRQAYIFDNGPDYRSGGYMRYVSGSKIGFMRPDLSVAIKAQYTWASPFQNGLAFVCQGFQLVTSEPSDHQQYMGGDWGVIDKAGEAIVDIGFTRAEATRLMLQALIS